MGLVADNHTFCQFITVVTNLKFMKFIKPRMWDTMSCMHKIYFLLAKFNFKLFNQLF